ncbi:MAG: metallophosphoesterase [Candidatus Latescibacteria bacterium]|nr:metallophosphoesterase [Candidatus Latescibacterota bacterium]
MVKQVRLNDLSVEITLAESRENLVVLHFADTHLCECDNSNMEIADGVAKAKMHFTSACPYGKGPLWHIKKAFEMAERRRCDPIVIGGDVMDCYTERNADLLEELLQGCLCDVLFSPGNHEVNHPVPYNRRRLEAIVQHDLDFFAIENKEVIFLQVNNSSGDVSESQLEQLRLTLDKNKPTFIFFHIPVYQRALFSRNRLTWGDSQPLFADPIVSNRNALECLKLLKTRSNICGIFAGHAHFSHEEEIQPKVIQFVVSPNFLGGHRWLRINTNRG